MIAARLPEADRPPGSRPRRPTILAALAVLALSGLGAAWLAYRSHAARWLRRAPDMPACVYVARRELGQPASVSASELHEAPAGEAPAGQSARLNAAEGGAARCAESTSPELGRRLAGALAERRPGPRALALLEVARRPSAAPEGSEDDEVALVAYGLVRAALAPLPEDLPEVRAARAEVNELLGCRFVHRGPCPRRPPLPAPLFAAGAFGAAGLLGLVAMTGLEAARRLRGRQTRRTRSGEGAAPSRGE